MAGRVEIWPEPAPEERRAILLALGEVIVQGDGETRVETSAWAAAGRDEATSGRVVKMRRGWGRGVGRLAAW